MNDSILDPKTNREQAFLVYATMCGDVVRTAAALGIPEAAVLAMADGEGWANKLGPILALKKSNRPGDVERAISRALCYVQAHQMRLVVQRAIQRVANMNETEFDSYLLSESTSKSGVTAKKLTTRALADLSSAMEKCHSMCYAALGDGQAERVKRKEQEGDDNVSAGDLHAQISAGLAAVRASATPRALLLEAQLSQAKAIAEQAVKPQSPNDNDDH